ncbi:beta-lactamase class A [Roseiarcus fermentans]|uniref:Beta-lactamase n=1 Tax=Roseiarcus fermentans TaxID=1473586 RepID=A0A366FRM0_9HYPH|nr:class A beta-lactamase [Roseiarcus fermentans]RBP17207.1 beta-lactamase class A [Roseiarcus fermentans]
MTNLLRTFGVAATRRRFCLGLVAAAAAPGPARAAAADRLAALERSAGGRLGVAVLDTSSGETLLRRADERFPMCSTFKLIAAAAVLKRVDAGQETLTRFVPYRQADLLGYAPVTKAQVDAGGMTLADLCAAAIDWSDNTAANLILDAIGGPAGFTAFARLLGDSVTRLDRNEPTLNTAIPGDPRDTTTPLAMARDLQAVLLGDVLSEESRRRLEAWLIADRVGDKRLRAGLPPDWGIGDKTGSGDHGTANTIAILRPPNRAPLLAAVYYTEGPDSMDARNAVNRQVGEIVAATF